MLMFVYVHLAFEFGRAIAELPFEKPAKVVAVAKAGLLGDLFDRLVAEVKKHAGLLQAPSSSKLLRSGACCPVEKLD